MFFCQQERLSRQCGRKAKGAEVFDFRDEVDDPIIIIIQDVFLVI